MKKFRFIFLGPDDLNNTLSVSGNPLTTSNNSRRIGRLIPRLI
jgi:hypothetical protein